jgi:cell fate (sporulation/competence/biofilm development) regulator YlbF (YheA/YmcA/DUF963 family)
MAKSYEADAKKHLKIIETRTIEKTVTLFELREKKKRLRDELDEVNALIDKAVELRCAEEENVE